MVTGLLNAIQQQRWKDGQVERSMYAHSSHSNPGTVWFLKECVHEDEPPLEEISEPVSENPARFVK